MTAYKLPTEQYIEIPSDKLREAIAEAYNLSSPQGLGLLHYREEPLDEQTIDEIMPKSGSDGNIRMDYVHGRSCKFHIFHQEGKHYVRPHWYDHNFSQLERLLERLGVEDAGEKIEQARIAKQNAWKDAR